MQSGLEQLISDVKHNCEITNARYYKPSNKYEFAECFYFENGMRFFHEQNPDKLNDWLKKKIPQWREIRNKSYKKIEPRQGIKEGILIYQNVKEGLLTSWAAIPICTRNRDDAVAYWAGKEVALDVLSPDTSFRHGNMLAVKLQNIINDIIKNMGFIRNKSGDDDDKAFRQALLLAGFSSDEIYKKEFRDLERKLTDFSKKLAPYHENHEYGHFKLRKYLPGERSGTRHIAHEMAADAISTLPQIIADKDEVTYNVWVSEHLEPDFNYNWPNLKSTYAKFPEKIDWQAVESLRKMVEKKSLQVLQGVL